MEGKTGGCACGAIRFKLTAPLMGVGICHCTECQKASGGGANYVALVPKPALEVISGAAKEFHRKGDSRAIVARAFCPDCGTPLWSIPTNEPFLTVKLGAFDDNSKLMPQMHIYTESAPKWHLFHDGLPKFPKMPPPMPQET